MEAQNVVNSRPRQTSIDVSGLRDIFSNESNANLCTKAFKKVLEADPKSIIVIKNIYERLSSLPKYNELIFQAEFHNALVKEITDTKQITIIQPKELDIYIERLTDVFEFYKYESIPDEEIIKILAYVGNPDQHIRLLLYASEIDSDSKTTLEPLISVYTKLIKNQHMTHVFPAELDTMNLVVKIKNCFSILRNINLISSNYVIGNNQAAKAYVADIWAAMKEQSKNSQLLREPLIYNKNVFCVGGEGASTVKSRTDSINEFLPGPIIDSIKAQNPKYVSFHRMESNTDPVPQMKLIYQSIFGITDKSKIPETVIFDSHSTKYGLELTEDDDRTEIYVDSIFSHMLEFGIVQNRDKDLLKLERTFIFMGCYGLEFSLKIAKRINMHNLKCAEMGTSSLLILPPSLVSFPEFGQPAYINTMTPFHSNELWNAFNQRLRDKKSYTNLSHFYNTNPQVHLFMRFMKKVNGMTIPLLMISKY